MSRAVGEVLDDMNSLERPESWPPFDDAGEVFIGRALQEVAGMAMELMLIHPQMMEEPFRRLLSALQTGALVARAGGEVIPPRNWFGPLGPAMLLSCSTNGAELQSGEVDAGPRKRWVSITRDSLASFLSRATPDAQQAPAAYVPPFVELILQAVAELGISPDRCPKHEQLVDYFSGKTLRDGTRVSASQAKSLATFSRPTEAMKGGQKRVG